MLLLGSLIYHDITYATAIIEANIGSDFRITTDTPNFALTGELWVSILRLLEKINSVITALDCIHAIHEMKVCQNLGVAVPIEGLCQFPLGYIWEYHHFEIKQPDI